MYLSTDEIAKDMGLAKRTIQTYCKESFLPAKLVWLNGKTEYKIESDQYLSWKQEHFNGLKRGNQNRHTRTTKPLGKENLDPVIYEWLEWCRTGMLTGKPIKPRTVELYNYYFYLYLKTLGKNPSKPLISINNARLVIGSFPVKSFSTKLNIYSALMSFAKYLAIQGKLEEDFRDKLKELRPRRYLPAKKTSLNEKQLEKLISSIDDIEGSSNSYDKLTSKALVTTLANTGLRASELCKLTLKDVDLESRLIKVRLGKGNKDRTVGINEALYTVLIEYLKARPVNDSELFFINKIKEGFNPHALCQKITRLSKRSGVGVISPHSLRRSFVTINAAKGKPLNHLRIACGHADITTTQGYCMTSQDEVIEAMKGW